MEFGEKLRSLREKEGMTQQTLAEQLYVTRQAVSRWECGARYPDLLMTRKIADIFGVSMDMLMSGEEVERDLEKEKLLAAPITGGIQTMLYTIAFIAGLLNAFYSLLLLLWAVGEGAGAAELVLTVANVAVWFGQGLILGWGLYFALVGRLSARRIAVVMGLFYVLNICYYTVCGIFTGQYLSWWLSAIWTGVVGAIVYFFFNAKNKVSPIGAALVLGIHFVNIMRLIADAAKGTVTLEVLSLLAIRILGAFSFTVLLLFQVYVVNRKRKEMARAL